MKDKQSLADEFKILVDGIIKDVIPSPLKKHELICFINKIRALESENAELRDKVRGLEEESKRIVYRFEKAMKDANWDDINLLKTEIAAQKAIIDELQSPCSAVRALEFENAELRDKVQELKEEWYHAEREAVNNWNNCKRAESKLEYYIRESVWIAVKDRLPPLKVGAMYLIKHVDDDGTEINYIIACYEECASWEEGGKTSEYYGICDTHGNFYDDFILKYLDTKKMFWMPIPPLPQPPEDKGE